VRNATTPSLVYYTLNAQDGSGAVRRATLGNGVVEQYGYEAETGRLASIQTGPSGSATLQNLSYDWDLAGNLEQRVDQLLSRTEVFNYDALDRLTGVVRNSATIFSLTYNNLIGNISSKTDSSGTFAYTYGSSRPHAVTAFGAMTFGYDVNGNMTNRAGGAITWTSYNLPAHLQRASGEYSDFLYGADRDRYRQIEGAGAISSTRHYASPGLFEVLTYDGGASRRDYHYIHANGRAVAQFTASGVEADELTYLHRDHQGSVVATTSDTGTLLDRFEYDPFGVRSTPVGSDARMHRGYTGHEHLKALDLIHMNGRVQDPLLGRFLSPDPVVQAPYDSRSLNRYSYVSNNPMTLVDPSGFQAGGCDARTTANCGDICQLNSYGPECNPDPCADYAVRGQCMTLDEYRQREEFDANTQLLKEISGGQGAAPINANVGAILTGVMAQTADAGALPWPGTWPDDAVEEAAKKQEDVWGPRLGSAECGSVVLSRMSRVPCRITYVARSR
jgi:RHS repeat-associated protein